MSEARGGSSSLLLDVVACIMGVTNAKSAIQTRISQYGGRVVARLGKEVSHVIWERRHSKRPSDKAADEAELLQLFLKLEKMEYPPAVVSPLWVEESIKAGRRLVERKYLVKKPTESLLGRTPGTGGGAAAKKRKRPAAAAIPKPAEAYELDDLHFSSTQQMQGGGPVELTAAACAGGQGIGASSRGGGRRQPVGGGGPGARAAKLQRGGRGARQAADRGMEAVVEVVSDDEEEAEADQGKEQEQQQQLQGLKVGSATQAVASILTIDLPVDCEGPSGGTPGGVGGTCGAEGDDELDELDTPLALRYAKSSTERAAGWGSGGSSGGGRHGGPPAAAAGGGADRRSRLALASGPGGEEQEEGVIADEAGEAMQVDDINRAQQQTEQPAACPNEQPSDPAAAEPRQAAPAPAPAAGQATARPAAATATVACAGAVSSKQVAARFSVRQLVQHPERPVLLHKGNPLAGSLPPPSPTVEPPAHPIPVPVVERVASPWVAAEQLPTQTPASQPHASASKAPEAAALPSASQPKAAGRRRLLGVSNVRRSSGGSQGAATTPAGGVRPLPGAGGEGKLPTPWSSLRPWDGRAGQQQQQQQSVQQQHEPCSGGASDTENLPQQQQQQAGTGPAGGKQQAASLGVQPTTRRALSAAADAAAVADAGAPPASAGGEAPGPSHGCIALTSVDAAVVELARSATRRLRGLRMCPEGREEGLITHLVTGDDRRTLKLMLAVANGSWLVSPDWVTASLEAGRWLPESQFPAPVRFQAAAERARSLLEVPDALPLLHGHALHIHLPDRARKAMAANAAALRRVAGVLGAKIVAPQMCDVCVLVGGCARPAHIPRKARCVQEEWLLQAAERFEVPPLRDFLVS